MKRWEYKTVKIKSKSVMRRIQTQATSDGWEIDSVKSDDRAILVVFRKINEAAEFKDNNES